MAEITGGDLLARCLANEGVKFVFGLPCPELDPLLAALPKYDMQFVTVRHEAAAVHMAEGIYKTTGQVAAVLGNPGPGSANLLPGVITARHEGVPVVVITAQLRPSIVYPASPVTFQGHDQLEFFRPAVKWSGPIFQWERIAEIVRMAFREMWHGRPGPVHLDIPTTLTYGVGMEEKIRLFAPERYRVAQMPPSSVQIEAAAQLLAGAKHPLIVSGAGVDRAGANEALLDIVTLLNCPVICTMNGRSTVPFDHPNLIYGFGRGGDLVKQEADVVLVVGSRLGNLDLPFDKYWGNSANQQLIQIDVDSRNMGVSRPITIGMVADAKIALEQLAQELKSFKVTAKTGGDLARYHQHAATWWQEQFSEVEAWSGPGIHPVHAARIVGKVFGKSACYFTDGGNTSLWLGLTLPANEPRCYHGICEFGMLGYSIPAAIGAKLANPTREVVCITGDGAAGFNFMEMQSAAREGLKITTIVFAEGNWTLEEPNELARYGKTFGTAMGTVRWDKVAEGLGCQSEYVEKLGDLEQALIRAREERGPSVICVKTDHKANLNLPKDFLGRFFDVYLGPT